MKIQFLATSDVMERVAQLRLANNLDLVASCDLDQVEGYVISSLSPGGAPLARGFVAGVITGDLPPAEAKVLEARVAAFAPLFSASPVLFALSREREAELAGWILRRLHDLALSGLTNSTKAGVELARMRVTLEKSEAALNRVERSLGRQFPLSLRYQDLPSGTFLPLDPAGFKHVIKEAPDEMRALDLLLDLAPGITDQEFQVRLVGLASDREVATWSVRERDLRTGWNRFLCPPRWAARQEDLVIDVRVAGEPSRCSVGGGSRSPGTWDQAVLKTVGLDKIQRRAQSFAIRVWSMTPGLEDLVPLVGHASDGAPRPAAAESETLIASDLLSLARPRHSRDSPLISLVGGNALQVHPKGRTPTVAVIPKVRVSSLVRLRARVRLTHPEADPTEFAMWASPLSRPAPEESRPAGRRGWLPFRTRGGRAASGSDLQWLSLQGEQSGEVEHRFAQPMTGEVDIFLATRNPNGRSSYSWAIFADLLGELSSA